MRQVIAAFIVGITFSYSTLSYLRAQGIVAGPKALSSICYRAGRPC